MVIGVSCAMSTAETRRTVETYFVSLVLLGALREAVCRYLDGVYCNGQNVGYLEPINRS